MLSNRASSSESSLRPRWGWMLEMGADDPEPGFCTVLVQTQWLAGYCVEGAACQLYRRRLGCRDPLLSMRFPIAAPKGGQLGSLGTSLDSPTPDDILQEQVGESWTFIQDLDLSCPPLSSSLNHLETQLCDGRKADGGHECGLGGASRSCDLRSERLREVVSYTCIGA